HILKISGHLVNHSKSYSILTTCPSAQPAHINGGRAALVGKSTFLKRLPSKQVGGVSLCEARTRALPVPAGSAAGHGRVFTGTVFPAIDGDDADTEQGCIVYTAALFCVSSLTACEKLQSFS
ncbi:unnamed protein product, partial [Staurois parvus]